MSYDSDILALSPLAYWKLNETSGTAAADSSGNGRGATYYGATLNQAAIAPGLGASARFASASSAYANSNATLTGTKTAHTITAWCKPSTVPTGANAVVVGGFYDGTTQSYKMGTAGDGVGHWFGQGYWSGFHDAIASSAPSAGSSYFLCAQWDGTTITVFVNGVSVATNTPGSGMPTDAGGLVIGARGDGTATQFWDGYISNVAIFGSAIGATAIANLYTSGNAAPASPGAGFHLPAAFRRQAVIRASSF